MCRGKGTANFGSNFPRGFGVREGILGIACGEDRPQSGTAIHPSPGTIGDELWHWPDSGPTAGGAVWQNAAVPKPRSRGNKESRMADLSGARLRLCEQE
jgi:hypothetical protein